MGQSRHNVKNSGYVQLNEYGTDLCNIKLSQHLTTVCYIPLPFNKLMVNEFDESILTCNSAKI